MAQQSPSLPLIYAVRWMHGDRPMDRHPKQAQVQGLFATRDKAERFRRGLEEKARRGGYWQPVWQSLLAVGFQRLTEFDYPIFLDWLEDHGVPAPPKDIHPRYSMQDPLGDWLANLTTEQAVAMYEGLHRFCFYKVVEVPLIEGNYTQNLWEDWEAQPGERWIGMESPMMEDSEGHSGMNEDEIPF